MKGILVRLGVCALAVFAMAATNAKSLEYILYDELTCEELDHGYSFNIAVFKDILAYYDGCVDYADSPASVGPNDMLSCKFIKEHALFVQGILNDIVGVYNIKCAPPCTTAKCATE